MDNPTISKESKLAFSETLHSAHVRFDGSTLAVSTGKIRRQWRVIPSGLSTVSLRREAGGAEWIHPDAHQRMACDWRLFGLVEKRAQATLTRAQARRAVPEGHRQERLEVEMVFQYAETEVEIRYLLWVIPNAGGIRTQLGLRALAEHGPECWPEYLVDSYAESLTVEVARTRRLAVGYYNDTQHRNSIHLPMMKEEQGQGGLPNCGYEIYDWANILHLQADGEGMALVKESHKCVNQAGVDTGAFNLRATEVTVTGLGFRINGYGDTSPWIRTDEYHEAWANWCVLYAGNEAAGIQAVKEFDRRRYPFCEKRDVYMNANTWGSRGSGKRSQGAAEEENILKELESCAGLGIDVLQIDDGWQLETGQTWKTSDWRPAKSRFPSGWKRVKETADRLGMKLGLWFAWSVSLERMKENCDQGDFLYLKLDFATLSYRHLVDELLAKARAIDRHNRYRGRISWDLTEACPRMGYFLGRDYGHLFVRNTQYTVPGTRHFLHVEYLPEVWLRDAWQYARHLNINQIYLTVQNKDRFDSERAGRYSHSYCFAITMMGIPTFFQETHLYTKAARDELRPLIAIYKQHRAKILGGFVTPIGAEPNNQNWTGFHCRVSGTEGYLTVFREIDNPDPSAKLDLPELPPGDYEWTDLVNHSGAEPVVLSLRQLTCTLPSPGGFLFLHYRQLSHRGQTK